MTYQVKILNSAQKEIREAIHYIRNKFGDEVAKERYAAIKHGIDLLKTSPSMGTEIPELDRLGDDQFRQVVIDRLNKAIYQIDDRDKVVYVHLFCSTRQDFQTILYTRLLQI